MSPGLRSKIFSSSINPDVGQLAQFVVHWEVHKTVVHRLVGCDTWKLRHFRFYCWRIIFCNKVSQKRAFNNWS